MFLRRDQIQIAQNNAYKKCGAFKIPLKEKDIEDLILLLSSKEKYDEGKEITPKDLGDISAQVTKALNNMKEHIMTKGMPKTDKKVKPEAYVMAATDYLYTLSMQMLGCPDIPVCFDDNVKKAMQSSAIEVYAASAKLDMTKEKSFQAQRAQNADDLRKGTVGKSMEAIKNNGATVKQIGQFLSDYQALCERQKRHGAIWRFFHSKENQERTALIGEMHQTLTACLGEKLNLDTADPVKVTRGLEGQHIKYHLYEAMNERFTSPEKVYGVPDRKKIDMKDQFSLFDNEMNQEKSQRVETVKVHESIKKENNEFSLL